MSALQEVKKRISPYMKDKGFQVRNKTYYYIRNNIAFCISFEQPSGWIYTWAHINPLYVPHDSIFLTYGNRLNNMSDVMLPMLEKDSSSIEIDEWCSKFCHSIDEYILPFFQQIDTPARLMLYVNKLREDRLSRRIRCAPLWADRLTMYTYLYMQDLERANSAATSFRKTAQNSASLTPSLREKLEKDADEIKFLIEQGEEAVSVFCEQTILNSKKFL